MSLDGFLDDASDQRLLLSNDADFDRVDEVRAASDAILVGAATVRNDDPRLQVRSAERVARRRAAGRPAQPLKVTVTNRAKLDPDARFFTVGTGPKLVYCASDTVDMAAEHLVVGRDRRRRRARRSSCAGSARTCTPAAYAG